MSSDNPEPYLDLDLGDGERVVLTALNRAEEWLQEEHQFWRWLEHKDGLFCDGAAKQMLDTIGEMKQALQRSTKQEHTHLFRETLIHIHRKRRYLFRQCRKASFIQRLREETGAGAATFALAHFIGASITTSDKTDAVCLRGQIRAVLFESGVDGNLRLETDALKALRDEYLKHLEVKHGETQGLLDGHKAAFDKQITECRTELDRIQADFIGIHALKEPAKYWEERRADHRIKALRFGWAWALPEPAEC